MSSCRRDKQCSYHVSSCCTQGKAKKEHSDMVGDVLKALLVGKKHTILSTKHQAKPQLNSHLVNQNIYQKSAPSCNLLNSKAGSSVIILW
jgi:hypothetical protein